MSGRSGKSSSKKQKKEEDAEGGDRHHHELSSGVGVAPTRDVPVWEVDEVDSSESSRVAQLVELVGSLDWPADVSCLLRGEVHRLLRSCSDHPWCAIHTAAMMGDINAVRGMVAAFGATSMTQWKAGCSGRTPLLVAVKSGQLDVAKYLWRVGGESCGQPMQKGRLATFGVRSMKVEVAKWAMERDPIHQLDSEQLYKMFSVALSAPDPETKAQLAMLLGQQGERIASVGMACAGARQCHEAMEALVSQGAKLLEKEYLHMLEVLPPGTFIEMLKCILKHSKSNNTSSVLQVKGSTLLRHAVVVGSPDLMRLLLDRGCRCEVIRDYNNNNNNHHHLSLSNSPVGSDEEDDDPKVWDDALWCCCMGVPVGHPHAERLKLGTDHSVELAEMLLREGDATPYLSDARGNRLLEALWCGYWWSPNNRKHPLRPRFELEDNRLRLMLVVQQWMGTWSPRRHRLFPSPFRQRVRTLLLCNQRLRKTRVSWWLPKDLMMILAQWLSVAEAQSNEELRKALQSFTMTHILTVLSEKGMDHEQPKKKRKKKELVDMALKAKEEDAQHARLLQQTATTLPPIIGRLVGREERSGETFCLDIVNPCTQPWVNIGRSFIKHPKGGATLDMDLSPVEFSRRISRLHATIRYNVIACMWEVQIRGRNGIEIDRGALQGPEVLLPSHAWIPLPAASDPSFRMPFAHLSFTLHDLIPKQKHVDNEDRTEKTP